MVSVRVGVRVKVRVGVKMGLTLCRPVYLRALRMAASFASAPPEAKRKALRSAGVTSARSSQSLARLSCVARSPWLWVRV